MESKEVFSLEVADRLIRGLVYSGRTKVRLREYSRMNVFEEEARRMMRFGIPQEDAQRALLLSRAGEIVRR